MNIPTVAASGAIGLGAALAVAAGKRTVEFANYLSDQAAHDEAPKVSSPSPVESSSDADKDAFDAFRDFLSKIGIDFDQAARGTDPENGEVTLDSYQVETWQRTSIDNWLRSPAAEGVQSVIYL